nr:immunoglobulin heavy chain junction region [Mus musculus]
CALYGNYYFDYW